jgi:hypothetical protein
VGDPVSNRPTCRPGPMEEWRKSDRWPRKPSIFWKPWGDAGREVNPWKKVLQGRFLSRALRKVNVVITCEDSSRIEGAGFRAIPNLAPQGTQGEILRSLDSGAGRKNDGARLT